MTKKELIKFLSNQAKMMRYLHGHEAAKQWTAAEEAAKKFLQEQEDESTD